MGDRNRWRPFYLRDESAMALYLKMFVRSYSIIVPNFKFVSQSAQFGQNLTPTTPTILLRSNVVSPFVSSFDGKTKIFCKTVYYCADCPICTNNTIQMGWPTWAI